MGGTQVLESRQWEEHKFWRAGSGRNTSFGEQAVGGTQVLESRQWEEHKFWRANSGRNTSFGEQTVGGAQVSDRFSKSISTEPYPEECEHSCQVVNKTGENVDKVKKLVFESRRIAVEMSECWEFHWIV